MMRWAWMGLMIGLFLHSSVGEARPLRGAIQVGAFGVVEVVKTRLAPGQSTVGIIRVFAAGSGVRFMGRDGLLIDGIVSQAGMECTVTSIELVCTATADDGYVVVRLRPSLSARTEQWWDGSITQTSSDLNSPRDTLNQIIHVAWFRQYLPRLHRS